MYKLLLVALAVLCASTEGGYVAPIDCMNECPSTSSVSCERGCRFYGLSLRFGDRNATMADCQQGCMEAYGAASEGPELTKSCLQGCNTYDDLLEKAAPHMEGQEEEGSFLGGLQPLMTLREVAVKTVNGVRMLQTRVVAFFLAGDQLVQVETQPQVFIDMPANGGLIHETPRQDDDSKEDSKPHVDEGLWNFEAEPRGAVTANRVEKVRVLRKDFQHLLAVLSTTLIILLVAFYVLVLYRRSLLRKHKQSNLAVAVQHEPLKLVLPEDLTKLSLVEEDEVPSSKQGISLPQAKV